MPHERGFTPHPHGTGAKQLHGSRHRLHIFTAHSEMPDLRHTHGAVCLGYLVASNCLWAGDRHLQLGSPHPRSLSPGLASRIREGDLIYFSSTETDVEDFRQCVKLTREIFAQEAFAPFRGKELQPGSHVQSDKEIDAFVRAKADSAYHPSCTCKMGQPSDPTAVVDQQTRVIGVENLRVIDASIMPSVVSGNLNAPTIMIAEKAADVIKGCPALGDENVPVYKPQTLDTQR